ncbi:hypothetical protein [Variovorax sp. RCC_210]|uniref:hypothetical protein n=1 Tax=Variovorax sp. RCC_210 TaxID=3239217 RepID=UPI0035252FEE
MDFTVYPIERVKAAFARALELNPEREAAACAAAQALGITPEAVREVVETVASNPA